MGYADFFWLSAKTLVNMRSCLTIERDYGAKISWNENFYKCKVIVDVNGKEVEMKTYDYYRYSGVS